ncbi:protein CHLORORESPIRATORY REDUCTION 6, chloroplastic isoform X2 [Rhododendron vialii]|uniref:protein CHLORORESPIRATORY REDUCTION 6, chloroplastic isoform X2 n=1 Tax=Rhododendron vialii TaxID=182163 RepID=UPI00265F7197|nr:protein CHLORORESPIRATORY REDUCTION 6, chloroplastic isoform X2 [Rhododendron vialii]
MDTVKTPCPISSPLKQSNPFLAPSWISSKLRITDSVSPSLVSWNSSRERGEVAVSVAFDPSGNYELSLFDDEETDPKEFLERTIGFTINYTKEDPNDPRELSELGEVRLWFVRLDAACPWLPVLLDWRAGELARYAAMLVPHQMSLKMGVVFNPEALELFVMNKVFIVYTWLKQHNIPKPRIKARDMARMLGFGIGDELFDLIDEHPFPPS